MQVLIPQKVAPPYLRVQLTPRPHLCQHVLNNLDRKVSLVSAPAGYGKTSLALELSRRSGLTTCWYHLDARDSNLDTFYDYLCEALAEQLPDFRAKLPQPSPDESAWGLAGLVTSTLYKHVSEPLLLVLDNFHEVEGCDAVSRFVDALVTYLPPTLHLVILSRTSTDLNLARLIAQQDLNLVTSQELRLSLDEAAQIADTFALEDETLRDLHQKVDGWVAGFTLLASRYERQSPNLSPDKVIRDYLDAEFFGGLTPLEQRFALHSAAFAPFAARDLRTEFGQDLEGLLERFADSYQMLYRIEDCAACPLFSYTPLVKRFLTDKLRQTDPETWRDLNVHIGERRWAEGRFEALEYLAKAERYDLIVEKLVGLRAELREAGSWRKLGAWLQDVPETDLRDQGDLLAILAETEVMSCPAAALRHYRWALETPLDTQTRSLALAGSLRATYKLQRFQAVIDQSKATLAELTRTGATRDLAQAHSLTASSLLVLGEYAEAKGHFDRVETLAEKSDVPYLRFLAARGLGAYADFVGDARQAVDYNEQFLAYWEKRGNTFEVAPVLNNLASNHYYLGDLETALKYALRALSMREELEAIGRFALLCCTLGDIYGASQQVTEGERYYDLALRHAQPNQFAYGYALQGRSALLVRQDKLAEADTDAREALELARENRLQLIQGLAHLRIGQVQQRRAAARAAEHFDRAITLFTSVGARRELGVAHLFQSRVVADETLAGEHRRQAKRIEAALGYPLTIQKQDKPEPSLTVSEQRTHLQVQTLGTLEFRLNGASLPVKVWNGRKPRDIVLFLAAARKVSRDQVIDALWDEGANLEQQFSIALSRARRALGQKRTIVRADQLYTFAQDIHLDEDARVVEATPPDAPTGTIQNALERYQGDYLPGYYDNWVETRREQLRTKALLLFGVALERLEASPDVPDLAARALSIDPCHEASHRQLIRYYLKHQGVTPARRQYAQYLEALDDMGMESNPDITALLNL